MVPRGDTLLQRSSHHRRGLQDRPTKGQGAGEQASEEWVGARDLPQGRKLALSLVRGLEGGKPKVLCRVCGTLSGLGERQQSGTASNWKQKAEYSLEGSVRRGTNRICIA